MLVGYLPTVQYTVLIDRKEKKKTWDQSPDLLSITSTVRTSKHFKQQAIQPNQSSWPNFNRFPDYKPLACSTINTWSSLPSPNAIYHPNQATSSFESFIPCLPPPPVASTPSHLPLARPCIQSQPKRSTQRERPASLRHRPIQQRSVRLRQQSNWLHTSQWMSISFLIIE